MCHNSIMQPLHQPMSISNNEVNINLLSNQSNFLRCVLVHHKSIGHFNVQYIRMTRPRFKWRNKWFKSKGHTLFYTKCGLSCWKECSYSTNPIHLIYQGVGQAMEPHSFGKSKWWMVSQWWIILLWLGDWCGKWWFWRDIRQRRERLCEDRSNWCRTQFLRKEERERLEGCEDGNRSKGGRTELVFRKGKGERKEGFVRDIVDFSP